MGLIHVTKLLTNLLTKPSYFIILLIVFCNLVSIKNVIIIIIIINSLLVSMQTILTLSDPLWQLSFYSISSATSLFQTLSIRVTPTRPLKHFSSRTYTCLLSSLITQQVTTLYNTVDTQTRLNYIQFFAFWPNPVLPNTYISVPHILNTSIDHWFSFTYVTYIFHIPDLLALVTPNT